MTAGIFKTPEPIWKNFHRCKHRFDLKASVASIFINVVTQTVPVPGPAWSYTACCLPFAPHSMRYSVELKSFSRESNSPSGSLHLQQRPKQTEWMRLTLSAHHRINDTNILALRWIMTNTECQMRSSSLPRLKLSDARVYICRTQRDRRRRKCDTRTKILNNIKNASSV